MSPEMPSQRVKAYFDVAYQEYLNATQRRGIIEAIADHRATIENSIGDEFFWYVAAWYQNDLALALARAFDGNSLTGSVRQAAKYLREHEEAVASDDVDLAMARSVAGRHGVSLERQETVAAVRTLRELIDRQIEDVSEPLKALKSRRDKGLAHHDLSGVPKDNLRWSGVTAVTRALAVSIECLCPLFSGTATHAYVRDGVVDLGGADRPTRALKCLLKQMAVDRTAWMPPGYELDNFLPACFRVRAPDTSVVNTSNHVDEVVAAAWQHYSQADGRE